jgi:iron-sulfur cluster repair protein YtfE (RIC family)
MSEKKLSNLALAEAKASDIMKKAQERRSALQKDAEVAAERESLVLRDKLQKDFEKRKYDITDEEKRQEEITAKEIDEVYRMYEKNHQDCIKFMLERVGKVDHKVSRNVKADFSVL